MIGMDGIAKERKWCCMYKRMTEQDKTRARRQVLVDEDDRDAFGTKECPVCHALCFDDMQTCYGCLHNFAADDGCFDWKKERLSENGMGSKNGIGPKGGVSPKGGVGSEGGVGPKGGVSDDLAQHEGYRDAGEMLSRQEDTHCRTAEDPRSFKMHVLPQEIEGQLGKNSSFSRAIACCENSLEAAGAPSAEEVRFSFKNPNGSQSDRELLEIVISVRSAQRHGMYESLQ